MEQEENAHLQENDIQANVTPEELYITTSEDIIEIAATSGEVADVNNERNSSTENLIMCPRKEARKTDSSSNWRTLPPVYFLVFTNFLMVLMVFILPVICNSGSESDKESKKPAKRCAIEPFSALIYRHVDHVQLAYKKLRSVSNM